MTPCLWSYVDARPPLLLVSALLWDIIRTSSSQGHGIGKKSGTAGDLPRTLDPFLDFQSNIRSNSFVYHFANLGRQLEVSG